MTADVPAIEIRGLDVSFGSTRVLRDVSASFPAGRTSGVVGPNGAGKSTLLNCISGLVVVTRGEIDLFGRPITNIRPHRLAGAGVGRSFQGAQFVGALSAVDNVMVGYHHRRKLDLLRACLRTPKYRRTERDTRERAMAALDRVGVAHLADRPVRELPFGVQKRVDIARALVGEPACMLLDEPMAGLTRTEKDEVAALLEHLRADGGPTMIVVEHDMRVVSRLCSSVVVLAAGAVLAAGSAADVLARPDVVAAYLGGSGQQAEEKS